MLCKSFFETKEMANEAATELAVTELIFARQRGAELAERVVALCRTKDVFDLAARAGARLVYARWATITVGEYCPRTGTITVNLAAVEQACKAFDTGLQTCESLSAEYVSEDALRRVIIAHELGHLFDEMLNKNGVEESKLFRECVSHSFASTLLDLPFDAQGYELLWGGLTTMQS